MKEIIDLKRGRIFINVNDIKEITEKETIIMNISRIATNLDKLPPPIKKIGYRIEMKTNAFYHVNSIENLIK